MAKRLLTLMIILSIASMSLVSAQDEDNPTVAILRYGGAAEETTFSEYGVLDMLQARAIFGGRAPIAGYAPGLGGREYRHLLGRRRLGSGDRQLMVDDALGREADVLITVTTPVTRAALNATADMDEPPPLLFASVFNPLEAGIAQPVCDKPAHATGSEIRAPYERALAVLMEQNPNLSVIGVISSSSEISGITGAAQISALAQAQGIDVERTAVISLPDFPLAARSLADAAVEAIIAPIDAVTAQALPSSARSQREWHPLSLSGAGRGLSWRYLRRRLHAALRAGLALGRLLTGVLDGELDTATTGIRVFSGESHSVNLDAAAEQGIAIASALINSADIVVSGSEDSQSGAFGAAYALQSQEYLASDEARAAASAAMESLACE